MKIHGPLFRTLNLQLFIHTKYGDTAQNMHAKKKDGLHFQQNCTNSILGLIGPKGLKSQCIAGIAVHSAVQFGSKITHFL